MGIYKNDLEMSCMCHVQLFTHIHDFIVYTGAVSCTQLCKLTCMCDYNTAD